MKIIVELGLNHMGSSFMATEIVSYLCTLPIYGITLQIREKEYYKKKPYLELPDATYNEIADICKKNSIMFGLSVCESDTVLKYNKYCSFWKTLSWKLEDMDLLKVCIDTNKPVHLSTGKHDTENIIKIAKNYIETFKKNTDMLNLIHTTLNPEPEITDIMRITRLKRETKLNIGFGLHSHHKEALYLALSEKPDYIFFYIKNDNVIKYPDNKNAILIDKVEKIIVNMKILIKML